MVKQERLIKEIKVLSDSIRKKNRKLKMGISERDDFIESTFKPVIQPLREISQKLNNPDVKEADLIMPVKRFKEDLDEKSEMRLPSSTIPKEKDNEESDEQEDEVEEEEEEEEDDDYDEAEHVKPVEESNLTVLGKDIASHGKLYRTYVLKMLHGTIANRKHHVYGARLEKNGLMIGNKELIVDEDDNIVVGKKTYHGTVGLFELIFKKIPSKFTSQDIRMYKDICLLTSMHKKNYLPTASVHRNTTKKYKDIISTLFPVKAGSGVSFKNTNKTNVIYYNNVNKLVERLKLLHEAQVAGHTGLNNETVALVEELRQRGYIE